MLIFDGHNDLLLNLWLHHRDAPVDAFFNGIERGHLDFPRMQQGGFFGGLFAIFVPPQTYIAQTTPHLADTPYQPLEIMWQQLAILKQIAAQSQGRARLCRSAAEIAACRDEGVLALVAHIEGADALDAEGEQLQAFYNAGVRSIGPFWNLPNRFGVGVSGGFPGSPDSGPGLTDACSTSAKPASVRPGPLSGEPDSGPGLTDAGFALIEQASALNMLIDVSHMNEKAFWDTAARAASPLVASHSNAHALCAQPRNLTDAQLIAIRDSGGMVGINFGNAFLRADGKRDSDTPLSEIVRHCERLIMVMGDDHVGFGSDFDGISTPEALKDVAGLPRLLAAFQDAGYDQERLEKLASRNWQRVLQKIWQG